MNKSIEELLTILHNDPEEEVIAEKWIDFDCWGFERNHQNELKLRYVNPLTPEECFRGRGIKEQIEDSDCIIEYTTVTREKFDQWLKDMGIAVV